MTMPPTRGVFVSTVPFGAVDRAPLDALEEAGIEYLINPLGRRLKPEESAEMMTDCQVVIAGTEPLTRQIIESSRNLKLIARVGIGLDSVDLVAAREHGIAISYTPEAPAPAVAELTIGLMINTLRHICRADRQLRVGEWQRETGRRVSNVTVGVVGLGRIGKRVVRHLAGFGPPRILATDVIYDHAFGVSNGVEEASLERICREADVISIHVPLTSATRGLISAREMAVMRSDCVLINTARGGIVNEDDLYSALKDGRLGAAAIDVFANEPYHGPLASLDNCTLTAHMGSMSVDCRTRMENEAVADAIRFFRGEPLWQPVPEAEYKLRA